MVDPFVVDESFKKKISSLKVTELHCLLRNLGTSYQANKDQLVKRLIQKYIQIYEQYTSGAMSFEEAKAYGDWVNESHIITHSTPPAQSSAKSYYQPPSRTGKPPISFNITNTPATSSSGGYGLASNYLVNNNSHPYNYNNNVYNPPHSTHSHSSSSSHSNTHSTHSGHSNHSSHSSGHHSSSSHAGHSHTNSNGYTSGTSVNQYKPPSSSTTLKSLCEVNYRQSSELVFPKSVDPFLEIETTISHSRLKTYSEARGRPTTFSFQMPDTVLANVKSGAWRAIVRCFEVQNNHSHVSQPHTWPGDCTLAINGNYMSLGIKKQTKPNAPPHPDKPLDISKEIRTGRNTVDITHSSSRTFAVVIDAMRTISVDSLVDVVVKNRTSSFESAKRTISLALGGDDKDIAALHTTVSLLCPLVRTPLALPVKSLACKHIQCFDLKNYLMMNQRTPSWKCPVCSTVANTTNLVVDAYFSELLRHVDSSVHSEVHINPSGDWSTIKPKTAPKQEPKPAPPKAISVASSPLTPQNQKVTKKPAMEVVDLISDDEDEAAPTPPKKLRVDSSPRRPMPIITSLASPPPISTSSSSSSSSSSSASASTSSISVVSIAALTHPDRNTKSLPVTPQSPSPSSSSSSTRRTSISTPLPSLTSLPSLSSLPPPLPSLPLPPLPSSQLPAPMLDLNAEIQDPYSSPSTSEAEFHPNLRNITSDLDPAPSSYDSKKRPSILVKLKAPPNSPPPQEPSLSSSPSTFTSPTPLPPPPSVFSESSGAVSSLEVPRLTESTVSEPTFHSNDNFNGNNDHNDNIDINDNTDNNYNNNINTPIDNNNNIPYPSPSRSHSPINLSNPSAQPIIEISDDEDYD